MLDLIPKASHELIKKLIDSENLTIKVVKTRKTKHGDFRSLKNRKFQITLNQIDNKYRFLITLVHELAHFKVFQSFGNSVNPHGTEWKKTYNGVEEMSVAVMGCVVNGPGESKMANLGISLPGTGEIPVAPVFENGKKTITLKGDNIGNEFKKIIDVYIDNNYPKKS